jgi:hypothetical protein
MKKFLSALGVVILATGLVGCASAIPMGALYTEVASPVAVGSGSNLSYSKVGVSKANSYFGLIATGDASIKAAVENGQIGTVKFVDYHSKNILGVIGEYTTTVYGD